MGRSMIVLLVCLAPAAAQVCATGTETFLKNDNLPQVPSGPTATSVIQGLCEGEACGAVFNVAGIGPSVKANLAAVGYFNVAGANGITAAADLEFYDGVSFSGPNLSVATLGPLIFSWSTATGSSIQLASHAINQSQDLSSYNVVATSGQLVCVWWMDFNPLGGSCPTGYQTNFGTDYAGGSCASTTPAQKNLIYIQGQGWRDASKATVSGFPLCPIFYAGNWVIRVCVEPTAPPAVLTIFGPPNPPPGLNLTLQYSSPADPNAAYVCGLSLGTSPGIPWPPYGTVPLNDDFALQFMLPDIFEQPGAPTNFCTGFTGNLNGSGVAFGNFLVPPVSGITLHFAFVALTGRISNAASITIP
jgi:hypothetical protein